MPQWIHDRAEHIRAKNPDMPRSMSFAIATQQAHSTGKSPKGYGTAEGREEAKRKYTTPEDDMKTADPSFTEKRASFFRAVSAVTPIVNDELDERTRHIIREELAKMNVQPSAPKKPSVKSKIASLLPFLDSFSDEVEKLANMVPGPSTVSSTKALIPRPSMRTTAPKYTQVNPSTPGSPAQQHQPVLGPPPVRG